MSKYLMGMLMIIILTMFLYQGFLQITTHYTKQSIVTIVETHSQMARMQGYFTPAIKTSLQNNLSKLPKVDINNVQYILTETVVCTRSSFAVNQQIQYEILIPIKNVNSKLFSTSDRDMVFPQRGYVTSEKRCGA